MITDDLYVVTNVELEPECRVILINELLISHFEQLVAQLVLGDVGEGFDFGVVIWH